MDPSDLSEVQDVAEDYMRDGFRLFTTTFDILNVKDCFPRVTANGSNTMLVIRETEIDINDQLAKSISRRISERLEVERLEAERLEAEGELFELDSSEDDNGIE